VKLLRSRARDLSSKLDQNELARPSGAAEIVRFKASKMA